MHISEEKTSTKVDVKWFKSNERLRYHWVFLRSLKLRRKIKVTHEWLLLESKWERERISSNVIRESKVINVAPRKSREIWLIHQVVWNDQARH